LRCGAEEGQRRLAGPLAAEMKYYVVNKEIIFYLT
jgi:hypothetical protein